MANQLSGDKPPERCSARASGAVATIRADGVEIALHNTSVDGGTTAQERLDGFVAINSIAFTPPVVMRMEMSTIVAHLPYKWGDKLYLLDPMWNGKRQEPIDHSNRGPDGLPVQRNYKIPTMERAGEAAADFILWATMINLSGTGEEVGIELIQAPRFAIIIMMLPSTFVGTLHTMQKRTNAVQFHFPIDYPPANQKAPSDET